MRVLNPERLTLARELLFLSQKELAELVEITPARLSNYENEWSGPQTEDIIERLADHLQVPVEFLCESESLQRIEPTQCFYRSKSRTPSKERKYVEGVQRLFREGVDVIQRKGKSGLRFCKANLPSRGDEGWSSPAAAAVAVRRQWGLGDGPIPDLVGLMEKHGIWVQFLPREVAENVDAFSLRHGDVPLVLLNPQKKDAYRSRFDAAHELGHLVLHEDSSRGSELEPEADAFAAEFLVPSSTWRREGPRSTNPYAYLDYKPRWRVSAGALIRRSNDAGLITPSQYRSAQVRYSQLGWRKGEPRMETVPHEMPRLVTMYLEALSAIGTPLAEVADDLKFNERLMKIVFGVSPQPSNVYRFPRATPVS